MSPRPLYLGGRRVMAVSVLTSGVGLGRSSVTGGCGGPTEVEV